MGTYEDSDYVIVDRHDNMHFNSAGLDAASSLLESAVMRGSTRPYELLMEGGFYWVTVEGGGDDPMPARFTGVSGGSPPRPTWDFLGKPSAEEAHEVTWVGTQILFDAA